MGTNIGETITQDDINLKLFQELEKLSEKIDKSEERAETFQKEIKDDIQLFRKEMREDSQQFQKNMREDMKQFQFSINSQTRWSLAIFTLLMIGILGKVILM